MKTPIRNAHNLTELLAAGAADPGVRLLADTLTAVRTDAAFVARVDDAAAAGFLEAEAPQFLAATAFQDVLSQIGAAEERDVAARVAAGDDPRRREIAALPSPVREAAFAALRTGGWTFGGFGIRRLPLAVGGAGHVELMRIEPGFGAAQHDHDGDELTLILTGAYHDGHAHYGPGDLSLARAGFSHSPVAEPGDICFVLAVSYGPPKFAGLFGVLQKVLGFPWTKQAKAG
jgi:putative transcriptional regulator